MNLKSSRRKFLKTVAAGVIGGEVLAGTSPLALAKDNKNTGGFEIQEGYTVFNDTTQKNMMKLAEAIVPGCESIGMKAKLMQIMRSSTGTASFFDAGLWNLEAISRKKFNVSFYQLENQSDVDLLLKHIRSKNRSFFQAFKKLVIQLYYSEPSVWKTLEYDGPPQPRGFMDYAEAPKKPVKVK